MSDYMEHRYLTDDCDLRERAELVIYFAPNGDYYIGSVMEGDRMVRHAVRIRMSGGASSKNPKLARAVVDLFQAMGGWERQLCKSCGTTIEHGAQRFMCPHCNDVFTTL